MSTPHVIVIGAGSTGSATAHDLALRGLRVIVIERGEVASGTTGRNHCLLHSGGRYCITPTFRRLTKSFCRFFRREVRA